MISQVFFKGGPSPTGQERLDFRNTQEFKNSNMTTTKILNGFGPYRQGELKKLASVLNRYPTWGEWVAAYIPLLSPIEIEAKVIALMATGLSEETARILMVIRLLDEPFNGYRMEAHANSKIAEILRPEWALRGSYALEDLSLKLDAVATRFDDGAIRALGIQVKALSFSQSVRIGDVRDKYRITLLSTAETLAAKYSVGAAAIVVFYGSRENGYPLTWVGAKEITRAPFMSRPISSLPAALNK